MMDCADFSMDFVGDLHRWAKSNEVPLSMTFELTPFCNFTCVMCYARLTPEQAEKHGKPADAAQWLEIARQAKEMGTLYLTLTGGEPFLHPEFWTIYENLNKMGFLITVLSNGSMIDESVIEKFRQYGFPYSMKLTLYGAGNDTYQRICGCTDGFTRVCRAVDLLKEAGVPLFMTSTIVRENGGDLQEIYRFARERGIPMQHTLTVVRSSRGAVNTAESSRFSFDEFAEELSLEALEKNKFPPLESPFAWCASCGASLWVTWNGRLQMCSFMSVPSVSFSGCLQEDWKTLMDAVKKLNSPAECKECRWSAFCQRCPGLLCAESGHPEKISEGLCRTAERLYDLYQRKLSEENKI